MEWNYTWISLNFTIFLLLWSSTFFQRSRASSSSLLSNPREPYPRLQLEILERFGLVLLPWRLDDQVREMSGVTASPSLVILDVDGQKRYRFESDKAGHAMPCYAMLFIAHIFPGKDWNLITCTLAGSRAGSGHCRNAWFRGSFSRGHAEGARLQRDLIIVNRLTCNMLIIG